MDNDKILEKEDFIQYASSIKFSKLMVDFIRGFTNDYSIDFKIPDKFTANSFNCGFLARTGSDFSDKKNIVIEINPLKDNFGYDLSFKDKVKFSIGLVLHECGHRLFTDFKLLNKALKDISNKKYLYIFKNVFNILEDARIERMLGYLFPGVSNTIDLVNDTLFRESLNNHNWLPKNARIDEKISYFFNYLLTFIVHGKKQEEIENEFKDLWNAVYPLALKARRSDDCQICCDYSYKITEDIIKFFDLNSQNEQDASDDDNDKNNSLEYQLSNIHTNTLSDIDNEGIDSQNTVMNIDTDGFDNKQFDEENYNNSGNKEGQESKENKDANSQISQNSENSKNSNNSDNSNDSDNPDDSSDSNGSNSSNNGGFDVDEIIKNSIKSYLNDCEKSKIDKNEHQKNYKGTSSRCVLPIKYEEVSKYVYDTYNRRQQRLKKIINETINRFKQYLNDNQDELIRYTHSGKIDGKSLSRILNGNVCAVRKENSDESELNITLLVDFSGSMRYRCSDAIDACVIFIETCNYLSIPLNICGFQSDAFTVFLDYKDKNKYSKCSIVTGEAHSSTPFGEALEISKERLKKIPHKDKIFICITDDGPNDKSYAKKELAEIEKDALVYGLGLGVDLSELFANFINVPYITELPKLLEIILKNNILKNG